MAMEKMNTYKIHYYIAKSSLTTFSLTIDAINKSSAIAKFELTKPNHSIKYVETIT